MHGNTDLHIACAEGKLDEVSKLLGQADLLNEFGAQAEEVCTDGNIKKMVRDARKKICEENRVSLVSAKADLEKAETEIAALKEANNKMAYRIKHLVMSLEEKAVPAVEAVKVEEPKKKEEEVKPQQQQKQQQQQKKEKKQKKQKQPKKKNNAPAPPADQSEIAFIDMRVGRIVEAFKHPSRDKLYVEKIECGEDEPRTICSGLVPYMGPEDLKDHLCVIMANLKPRKMGEYVSNGMVVCASGDGTVQILDPPAGCKAGDKVTVVGHEGVAATANQVMKKKILEKCFEHLHTNDKCEAMFKEGLFTTEQGIVTCKSIANGTVG
eukprot:TRINITY_DN830_c1_g2_i1.p1 TRINITY_DN830_c1_g2~~TRINITY_DN830_c1_g2_i1.p1  ORF type:complete len:323 (-),score=150.50 TRINITY_DN830_c1_g2_i1:115-1083(-)